MLVGLDETARTVGLVEFDSAHLKTFFVFLGDIGD